MRRPRITITLNHKILENLDNLTDGEKIRNRSHAIEYILSNYFKPSVKKAVILAGGEGAKFRPFTYEIPKSLLPIKGKPLLEHLIENLKKNNIYEIILCIDHLAEKIKNYFGDGGKWGVRIIYSQESNTLQTGGALLKVKKYLQDEAFMVIHGDILTDFYFKDIIDFHLEQNSLATIALTTVGKPSEFGQLKLHGKTLVNFYQKGEKKEIKSYLVNCGIYVFEPQIFDYFPEDKTTFLLEDTIAKLVEQKKMSGFVYEGQWFDVGNPENYEKAIKEFHYLNQKS